MAKSSVNTHLLFEISEDAITALIKSALRDRVAGCLFGSALGDAVGLYTEFLSAARAEEAYPSRSFTLSPEGKITPFRRDRHRNPHRPGEWTDDTDHALLIVLDYLHCSGQGACPKQFAARLFTWTQQGLRALDTLPLGLGRTVGTIVRTPGYLEDPEATARKHWTDGGYNAAPNGSLMRTHPVGLFCLGKSLQETFQLAADYSVVTHVDPRCVVSCAIGSALVRGILLQEVTEEIHIEQVVSRAAAWFRDDYHRSLPSAQSEDRQEEPGLDVGELLRHTQAKDLAELQLDDGPKIGYVYKTLGSGIYLLRQAMRHKVSSGDRIQGLDLLFESLITDLVMSGGDADTNACFAGALLGTYLGYQSLPASWRDGLRYGSWLMTKTDALCCLLGVKNGSYVGSEDKDTAPDGGRGEWSVEEMDEKVMVLQARMVKEDQEWKAKQETETKKSSRWFKRS